MSLAMLPTTTFIYFMVGFGIIGMILIFMFAAQSIYHLYFDTHARYSKYLYLVFYLIYFITCFAYTFLKSDLLLPMNKSIDCRFAQYLTTNAAFIGKFLLFLIFIFRIDVAFHSSSFGYSRKLLAVIVISYTICIFTGNILYIANTFHKITFTKDYMDTSRFAIGICTLNVSFGDTTHQQTSLILGLMTFIDAISALLLCGLFVYKLNEVLKYTAKSKSKQSEEKQNKLKQLMKKQTGLVLFVCIISIIFLGIGGIFHCVSLLTPIDAVINGLCVWLMFTFNDDIWNKMIDIACCCACNKTQELDSSDNKQVEMKCDDKTCGDDNSIVINVDDSPKSEPTANGGEYGEENVID